MQNENIFVSFSNLQQNTTEEQLKNREQELGHEILKWRVERVERGSENV
jgi:hypothetical protein